MQYRCTLYSACVYVVVVTSGWTGRGVDSESWGRGEEAAAAVVSVKVPPSVGWPGWPWMKGRVLPRGSSLTMVDKESAPRSSGVLSRDSLLTLTERECSRPSGVQHEDHHLHPDWKRECSLPTGSAAHGLVTHMLPLARMGWVLFKIILDPGAIKDLPSMEWHWA